MTAWNFASQFAKLCSLAAVLTLVATCGGGGETISPPNIVTQPQSSSIAEGGSATFAVTAIGAGVLTYRWQRNGVDIASATDATYTTGPETFSNSGAQIRVRVSNEGGEVLSEPAQLKVTASCAGPSPNSGWCRQGPTQESLGPGALSAVDANVAWIIKSSGYPPLEPQVLRFLRTTDGGQTWSVQQWTPPVPTNGYSYQLSAVSATVAWLMRGGMIFKTVDGGGTWTTKGSFTYAQSVTAVSADVAWVEDIDCMQTTADGGKSWTKLSPCFRPNQQRSLSVASSSVAWAITIWAGQPIPEKLIVSVDGGNSWSERSLPKTESEIWAIAAIDARTAWVVGDSGVVFKTVDGGYSWSSQTIGTSKQLWYVKAIDASVIWAGGQELIRSTDGGATWLKTTGSWGGSVDAVSALTAWQSGALISRTTDGGQNWIARLAMANGSTGILRAVNSETAWVSMSSSLIRTVDAGASWMVVPVSGLGSLSDLAAVSGTSAWASDRYGFMGLTTDAGQNWRVVDSQLGYSLAVAALDARTAWFGWIIVLKTPDSGASWDRCGGFLAPSRPYVYAISLAPNNAALWAAGYLPAPSKYLPASPFIAKSTDGCKSWTMTLPAPGGIIAAVDELTAWTVGGVEGSSASAIYHTSDGGVTWTKQYVFLSGGLRAIAAGDRNTAWAVGNGGVILNTVDGGSTWATQPSGTASDLHDVKAVNGQIAWIVGDGVLLKTTTGGN